MANSIIEQVQALEGIEEKKNYLRAFSKKYGEVAKANGTTINALLVLAYGREGAVNVKTFNQWKQEGKRVKKGSKSLILWSGIVNTAKEEGSEEGSKFFKIAFVFPENNVETI
jgi:hypothetical protein